MTHETTSSAHDNILEISRQPRPLWDVEYLSATGAMDFSRLQLGDVVLSLLVQTAEFRKIAKSSYRDFHVSAGAMALKDARIGRVLGYNIKLDGTDLVNIHAEDLVLAKASDSDLDKISVLSVIGPTQEDHVSGQCTPTLHPCGRCRERLRQNPLISGDTLFVTAKPDFTAIQLASLDAIDALHNDGDGSGVQSYYFETTPEVFSPLPQPDEHGHIRPSEYEVDDTDWQHTVGQFLMARYVDKMQQKT